MSSGLCLTTKQFFPNSIHLDLGFKTSLKSIRPLDIEINSLKQLSQTPNLEKIVGIPWSDDCEKVSG